MSGTEKNELAPALSGQEQRRWQEKLLELLGWQVRRYTGGDSGSVPVETGQALLESLLYCLDGGDAARQRALLGQDLHLAYFAGVERLREKMEAGRALWQRVCQTLPAAENRSMLDTLRSMGAFWTKYDRYFNACDVPCDIDYPLALPVSESLLGVDYVNRYLAHLGAENAFLRRFAPRAVAAVLTGYYRDYVLLPVNLFEPVAANALAQTVLGRPEDGLALTSADLAALERVWEHLRREELAGLLESGAETLTDAPGERDYLRVYAGQLARRIAAVRDWDALGGIFTVTA